MKRILVIDDQPNLRRLVQVTLRSVDRLIMDAESAEKGIEVARSERPDLIIMDLVMPGGMGGLEAVEILKSDRRTRECPVLILTARDHMPDRLRAGEIGAVDYLIKPFRIEILQKVVDEILD